MTVLPFPADRTSLPAPPAPTPPSTLASDGEVRGAFSAPSGARGVFTGTYRMERLRSEFGQLTAAGVMTGELVDVDGTPVALGSRRHTAAAELVSDDSRHVVRIGPVDVNIAGFMVTVEEIEVSVPRDLPSGP
jgi:hypothetical protein